MPYYTREEWLAAFEAVNAAERERLGDPPPWEEVEAYMAGELSPEDEQRVRDVICCYPDLVGALVSRLPPEEPKPGDPDWSPPEVIAQQLAQLYERMGKE